jgi:hypothetical protein
MAILQITETKFVTWLKSKTERLLEQRWLNLGLRAKMGAMVTIGLLSLMTIFGLLAVSSARQATQQALNERLMVTRMSADALDTILLHILDDLVQFAQSPVVVNLTEDLEEQELSIPQLSIFHKPIYFINSSGELIATSAPSPPPISWKEISNIQHLGMAAISARILGSHIADCEFIGPYHRCIGCFAGSIGSPNLPC